ncbi:MAG: malto-oligosyltrehalose trehalohydrolase [Candidatus Riflebacteria bacterium]|nr:malto-oligosyltrehalose trehalohydrolase [Candidatus Riflebacteria bacterium]
MKKIGAWADTNATQFRIWAPCCPELKIKIGSTNPRISSMHKKENGYFELEVAENLASQEYSFILPNGDERPDPTSFFQPRGVHNPSQVIDHQTFSWTDKEWKGLHPKDLIIYELHVGTFSPSGNLAGVQEKISHLKDLGINAIELMPLSQFPGSRNWGYDGVHPFSVQNSYGSVNDLKKLVDACHHVGIAVILDLVYNHLGPEGNYLGQFGPYFTDRYKTPWGWAINYDGPRSDEVRAYFFQNALYWFEQFHIDALRLDAIHTIFDFGAKHFLQELQEYVRDFSEKFSRSCFLIAESDLNDTRIIDPADRGGYALDAQWSDDFHHCLHTLVTGEKLGYYEDFGALTQFAKCLSEGFVYSWEYSPHRKKHFGSSSKHCPSHKFVVCTQNHDQVGNRMLGERLSSLVSFEAQKMLAAQLLTAPFIPMLFMGEEWAETAPFLFFVSHQDDNLVQAVREGRKKEFVAFRWKGEPPDPQSEDTFTTSRLHWELRTADRNRAMLDWYKYLIHWRKTNPAVFEAGFSDLRPLVVKERPILTLQRQTRNSSVFSVSNFSDSEQEWEMNVEIPAGPWKKIIDSTESRWHGTNAIFPSLTEQNRVFKLPPFAFILWQKES